MPLVDVTLSRAVADDLVPSLSAALPHAVSLAVACAEEPYDSDLRPGDVVLRFHRAGPHDRGGLDVLVEVRTAWYASRQHDRQARCDGLRDVVVAAVPGFSVGVFLTLPVAAWSQSD